MGALAMARAMATRCCSPPESLAGEMAGAGAEAEGFEQGAAAQFGIAAAFTGDQLGQHDVLEAR